MGDPIGDASRKITCFKNRQKPIIITKKEKNTKRIINCPDERTVLRQRATFEFELIIIRTYIISSTKSIEKRRWYRNASLSILRLKDR